MEFNHFPEREHSPSAYRERPGGEDEACGHMLVAGSGQGTEFLMLPLLNSLSLIEVKWASASGARLPSVGT